MSRIIVVALFGAIVFANIKAIGYSDSLSLWIMLLAAIFLYMSLIKIHYNGKRALRVNSSKHSWLYGFLSDEPGLVGRLYASLVALTLAVTMGLMLKGLSLNHGVGVIVGVVVVASFILFPFINKPLSTGIIDRNVHGDIVRHGSEITRIIISVILLNFIFALALSGYDVHRFLANSIPIDSFPQFAARAAIEENGENLYTKFFVNLYLLLEYGKIAISQEAAKQVGVSDFYLFFLLLLVSNFLKMAPLSLSIVLFQKGLDASSRQLFFYLKWVCSPWCRDNK